MKDLNLLVWLTQLGLSVVVPLAGFVLLSVWIQQKWSLGVWVILLGVALGLYCAIDGLRQCLKTLSRMSKEEKQEPPSVSFNDHD